MSTTEQLFVGIARQRHLSTTHYPHQPTTMAGRGRLEGKVAIVTGGASGFGRGIAAKFAEEGARVVIADLAAEAGAAAAAELQCAFVRADVTKEADWAALLRTALDAHGRLDVVVNNAGMTYANKPTETVTEADFDLVMAVNVKSVWLSAHVLLPYFLARDGGGGCFLQVASTAGVRPRPGLTWYNASKAAVINATKVWPMTGPLLLFAPGRPLTHAPPDHGRRVRPQADPLQRGVPGGGQHGHVSIALPARLWSYDRHSLPR